MKLVSNTDHPPRRIQLPLFMKKITTFILLLLSVTAFTAKASHYLGSQLSYTCVSSNVFQIKWTAFIECGGITLSPAGFQVQGVGTSCTPPTGSGWSTTALIEITPMGPGYQSTCTGGTAYGIGELTATNNYNFSNANCLEYNMSWSHCCRHNAITSGAASQDVYLAGGTIRPGQTTCNSSPQWRGAPALLLPTTGGTYDLGSFDPDGDSVVHSLAGCLATSSNMTTYNPGYSSSQPLGPNWTVSLDPNTGFATFNPSNPTIAVGVVCIKAEEYRNGVKIGEVNRDFTAAVITGSPCTPSAAPAFTGITNLNNAFYLNGGPGTDTIYVHPGSAFCFDVTTLDPDMGIDQTLSWDQTLPGATFTNPGNTQSDVIIDEDPTGRLCWTAPNAIGYIDFNFTLKDSSCFTDIIVPHSITIMVGDTGLVWPGDANNDLIANNLDLLALGLAYGSTGPARLSPSTSWIGQVATPWMDTIPGGIDHKYQDCNGDGTVNVTDALAITLNYGLTHTKTRIAATRGGATDPPLRLIIPQDSASVGDTITAIITLGDSSVSATDVYGIAFSLNYDATLIDSTTFRIEFTPSWLGNSSNSMEIDHNNFTQAACDGAQVRTDHQNVSGMGQIATAHFIIIDNIDGKRQLLTTEMLNFFFSDIVLISESGERLAVDPQADSVLVYELSTEFEAALPSGKEIKMYPNPAVDNLTLFSEGSPISEFEVWNLQGQLAHRAMNLNREKIRFSTNQLPAGVYFVKVRNELGLQTFKLHITR